jgi:hypothetical protein
MSAENLSLTVGQIQGLNTVVRELEDLEPGLVKQLRNDLVTEIKPLYTVIKRRIESSKPFLSGFEHNGETGLNRAQIKVTGKASTRKRAGKNTLLSVRASTNVVRLADMSGRKNPRGRTAAGQAMIANLNASHRGPSRFVWPSVENEIPKIQQSTLKIVEDYANKVNRRILLKADG